MSACQQCEAEGREPDRGPDLSNIIDIRIDHGVTSTGRTVDPTDDRRAIFHWRCDQGHEWTSVMERL